MLKNNRTEQLIKAVLVCCLAALIMLYPSQAAAGTVRSINVCIESIIPSMFAFMVISTYIQSSGLYRIIFRPLMPLMKLLIRADESIISIFLLSLIGGYPVGIKLLKENSERTKRIDGNVVPAETAAAFCYCISPSFALIMIGSGVFGSSAAGGVIYISNIAACLITGIIVSRISDLRSGTVVTGSSGGLTEAVNSASRALFTVCSVIVAFNITLTCVSSLLEDFGVKPPALLLGTLEISNLLGIERPSVSLIPLVSAIASTGGACVLLQCAAIAGKGFSKTKFLIARLPCAVLSGVISFVILQFTEISVTVSTISPEYDLTLSANKLIVPVLIAMCIIIFYRSDKIFRKV